ncbi:hypothetical protein CQA62_04540 [Helicobacter cholecystus]|uniref:Chaperone NapD n=1 Tax=Helicobacter cholecystus TaxID=45498 RepID=A0A3D8IWW6_9HELI|nr:chaperone NapD [Helicobacter cholecystus]RDU69104.1 hypothetical protein CQA62_04540 [Helicobacter cholecystus]VEJ24635.1 periplasmic nitrate reductase component [Helicobacter cholecystus]
MNISSIIIYTNNPQKVMQEVEKIKGCEIALSDEQKQVMIAVIEAENVNAEMEILKSISAIDGVIEANMHYSYAEEELESAKENISREVSKNLSDEVGIDEISYSGSVYNQMYKL